MSFKELRYELPREHKSRRSLNDSELCHSRSGMRLGKSVKQSKAACSSLQGGKQQVAESPARGLIPDRLGNGGQEKGSELHLPLLGPGKLSNQKANDLSFLPSVQKERDQFGLHQNTFRLRIKHEKLWHNYSITTKNLLVLRHPSSNSASRSTVFSKSISSSEIMFLSLPHRPPIQDLEGYMRFTYRLFFSFN